METIELFALKIAKSHASFPYHSFLCTIICDYVQCGKSKTFQKFKEQYCWTQLLDVTGFALYKLGTHFLLMARRESEKTQLA